MKKRGQVWVETVIYTLIAFVMIGLVLAFARPKINEIQDDVIISQSIAMMEDIDTSILDINTGGEGNKRILDVGIKKGELKIDGVNNKLIFEVEIEHIYSELERVIEDGNLKIVTSELGSAYKVMITRDYADYDIRYGEQDVEGILSKSPNSYKLSIKNKGPNADETKTIIDFEVI